MTEYMTEVEACKRLHVSRFKLFHLRKEGLPFRKIGRTIRYIPEEVDRWIEENFQGQTQKTLEDYKHE